MTSIIIPCWNKLRYTKRCVESVLANTRAPYELIFVDNGSRDGTGPFIRALKDRAPFVRVIRNEQNLGFPKAINQGTDIAGSKYVVWLNNDTIVTAGWLERMIHCAASHRKVGAVGPRTNQMVGPQGIGAYYEKIDQMPAFAQALSLMNDKSFRQAQSLTGFCLLLKSEAVKKVGKLDERFGLGYYEDFDYCLRLRSEGYQLVIANDVFIHHCGRKSIGGPSKHLQQLNMNRQLFIDKWGNQALQVLAGLSNPATFEPRPYQARGHRLKPGIQPRSTAKRNDA